MIEQLLNRLRYKSEGTDIDFKSKQYGFAGANELQKSEMLKDILAMANAWREGPAYILLGFLDRRPHPAEVVGITEHIDDSTLQEFVNSKVKPKLTFHYEEHVYAGQTVGVITIPKQKRTFFVAKPYGKLKANIVYVRRGSSTDEAEPTEIAQMALDDSGRGDVSLDLTVLAVNNQPLQSTFDLKFLRLQEGLPDYKSEREVNSMGMLHVSLWHDNSDFWREYAEYVEVNAALVEMKFVLRNRSASQLSHAKLEVRVEPLDGQDYRMLEGTDLPGEPRAQYDIIPIHHMPNFPNGEAARLVVDEDGPTPVCHVRFGLLLPSEEAHSEGTLAFVPRSSGKFRLRFRILASELSTPVESEQIVETTGEAIAIDFVGLQDLYGNALEAKYLAQQKQQSPAE